MESNKIVVIGGSIAVGKSSIVNLLPFDKVYELDYENVLTEILLEETYKRERVKDPVIELYFLLNRKEKYIKYGKKENIQVFDRSIFESLWFAKTKMSTVEYDYFYSLWKKECQDVINKVGKPYLYILLTCSWDSFKKRIYKRGRLSEINNFEYNENFFYEHVTKYQKFTEDIFRMFGINYIIINTDDIDENQVTEIALEKINKY